MHNSQNACTQHCRYLDIHTCMHPQTCTPTDIHTETHTCAHRHNYSYMQAEKPADLQHIHRWPQTRMALTETPTPTCTHVHTYACSEADTYMHSALEIPARQQAGYPWVWAQCPHPRWHCHKVISTTNRHQLPSSLQPLPGGPTKASWAGSSLPRCRQCPRAKPPYRPSWPVGNPCLAAAAPGAGVEGE